LNVGFVLNYFNEATELASQAKDITLLHILEESVIGISYTNDLFLVRFAYRLDSDKDCNRDNPDVAGEEDEFLYRIEEHVLANYLPDFRMWAMGYFLGVRSDDPSFAYFRNWVFAEYAPEMFTAQVRVGYDWIPNRNIFSVKPSFYWNFFNKMLSIGASFAYAQDSGEGKKFPGSPYEYIEFEPKIQLNFASSYIAFVYNIRREYKPLTEEMKDKGVIDPIKQTQWINLRFCLYF
jgi:hypothetical protein